MMNKAETLIGKECKIRLISGQNGYGKILKVSKTGLLVKKIDDFRMDGYCFFAGEIITEVLYRKQEKFFETLEKYKERYKDDSVGQIDIKDFASLFSSIAKTLILIETKRGKNYFCKIIKKNKEKVTVQNFDAYGKREKKKGEVKYKNIFRVEFSNDYLLTFKKYMEKAIISASQLAEHVEARG